MLWDLHKSLTFSFFPVAFPLLQALLFAHRLLVSLYLLSPMTCFVATATCHNPPSVQIFLLAVTCVLSHNALQLTPSKYEQTKREGSYVDHRLVNTVCGLTSLKSKNTFSMIDHWANCILLIFRCLLDWMLTYSNLLLCLYTNTFLQHQAAENSACSEKRTNVCLKERGEEREKKLWQGL